MMWALHDSLLQGSALPDCSRWWRGSGACCGWRRPGTAARWTPRSQVGSSQQGDAHLADDRHAGVCGIIPCISCTSAICAAWAGPLQPQSWGSDVPLGALADGTWQSSCPINRRQPDCVRGAGDAAGEEPAERGQGVCVHRTAARPGGGWPARGGTCPRDAHRCWRLTRTLRACLHLMESSVFV